MQVCHPDTHAVLGLTRLFQMLFADASSTPCGAPSQLVPMTCSSVSSLLRWRGSYPFLPAWQCLHLHPPPPTELPPTLVGFLPDPGLLGWCSCPERHGQALSPLPHVLMSQLCCADPWTWEPTTGSF